MEKRQLIARIEELRKERGWSKLKLNEDAGLTAGTIYQWYRTERMPTINNLECVCNAFGISLIEFFADDSAMREAIHDQELYQLIVALSEEDKKQFIEFLRKFTKLHCKHDGTRK